MNYEEFVNELTNDVDKKTIMKSRDVYNYSHGSNLNCTNFLELLFSCIEDRTFTYSSIVEVLFLFGY